MGLTPSTNPGQLKDELEKYQVQEANMDATEREVNRSSDYEVQKEFYSGKKQPVVRAKPIYLVFERNL